MIVMKNKKLMVRRITQGGTYNGIKFKMCSIMLLYSKEGYISMIGTELQKVEPVYNKKQETITINWRSNQQAQKCKILQQIGSYLGI